MALAKSVTVMNHSSTVGGVSHFSNFEEGDEPSEVRHFQMRDRDWEDMGSPEKITVTVEPGDLLNRPVPADIAAEVVPGSITVGRPSSSD